VVSPTPERLKTAFLLLLLIALIAVQGTRAVRLARYPEELGGIDERKWFHAAGPITMPADTFGAVRNSLPPGEEIWLVLPPEWGAEWWWWMARYHLPAQQVAGFVRRGEPSKIPAGAWIVAVRRDGSAVVRRTSSR
jgi:hypothetical protein